MSEISVIQIIKGFLVDIADVSWSEYDGRHTGKFPARLGSSYRVVLYSDGLGVDSLHIFNQEKQGYSVRFTIKDETLYWAHAYETYHDDESKCRSIDVLRLADPKFFENFVQVICLNLCEPVLFEFILKRIINRPKLRAICPENRMRHCRRYARYVMSCEEISEFIWK